MLIALAGLPGTGKSTLAARLAQELGGIVLSKDTIRAALFPPPALDYSRAQDDLCMAAIAQAVAYILKTRPLQTVILDGRTFLRAYQVHNLLTLAATVEQTPHVIECVCADAVARARLEQDRARGAHPAENRNYALYCGLQTAAEPLSIPRLVLDTGSLSLEECVRRSLEYVSR